MTLVVRSSSQYSVGKSKRIRSSHGSLRRHQAARGYFFSNSVAEAFVSFDKSTAIRVAFLGELLRVDVSFGLQGGSEHRLRAPDQL